MAAYLIALSICLQLFMATRFLHEAAVTKLGTYCRVKCTLAALVYTSATTMLVWAIFNYCHK